MHDLYRERESRLRQCSIFSRIRQKIGELCAPPGRNKVVRNQTGSSTVSYVDDMKARLPATMSLAAEFEALFTWIEANDFFMASQRFPGDRLGMLGPAEEPYEGTIIMFRIETRAQAQESGDAWFRGRVPDIADRLVAFARSGSGGSHVAFWTDEEGRQQIVHLGSEGRVGILTPTPLDFLRLLSVGYEEISGDCLDAPDEPPDDQDGDRLTVNDAYRSWLTRHYGVTIPGTASEVMNDMPEVLATTSSDPFWNWVRQHQGE